MDKEALVALLGQLNNEDLAKVGLQRSTPPASSVPDPAFAAAAVASDSSSAAAASSTAATTSKKRRHGTLYYLDFRELPAFKAQGERLNGFFVLHKVDIRTAWRSAILEECPEGFEATRVGEKLQDIQGRFRTHLTDALKEKQQHESMKMFFDSAVREFSKEFAGQRFRNTVKVANKSGPDHYTATRERRSDGTFISVMHRRIGELSDAWKTNFLKALKDQASTKRKRKSRKRTADDAPTNDDDGDRDDDSDVDSDHDGGDDESA